MERPWAGQTPPKSTREGWRTSPTHRQKKGKEARRLWGGRKQTISIAPSKTGVGNSNVSPSCAKKTLGANGKMMGHPLGIRGNRCTKEHVTQGEKSRRVFPKLEQTSDGGRGGGRKPGEAGLRKVEHKKKGAPPVIQDGLKYLRNHRIELTR